MKKSEIEKKLESQVNLRLDILAKTTDLDERNDLIEEISAIEEMRRELAETRGENATAWIRTAIQTGVPTIAMIMLSILGFSSEQLNGNPNSFTLRWLFNRAPK